MEDDGQKPEKEKVPFYKKVIDSVSDTISAIGFVVILIFAGLIYLILNPDKVQEVKSDFKSGYNKVEPIVSTYKIIVNDINSSDNLNDFKNKIAASFSSDSTVKNDTLIIQPSAISSDTSGSRLSKIGDTIRTDSFEVVLNSCQITDRLQIGGDVMSPETNPNEKNILIVNVSYRNVSDGDQRPPTSNASIKFEGREYLLKEGTVNTPGWGTITDDIEHLIIEKTTMAFEIPKDLITNPIYWKPDADSANRKFICDTVIYAKNLTFKANSDDAEEPDPVQ